MKALYKTVWEYKQRDLVDMAADRGAFIDQSQVCRCPRALSPLHRPHRSNPEAPSLCRKVPLHGQMPQSFLLDLREMGEHLTRISAV